MLPHLPQLVHGDFYPRPPGGGRLNLDVPIGQCLLFLSTPSGWRATRRTHCRYPRQREFLSTPSGWRATVLCVHRQCGVCISIHALRVEGDARSLLESLFARLISIHALRVEGDALDKYIGFEMIGISIHALRVEGDRYTADAGRRLRISIHALRVEGDLDEYIASNAALIISIHALRVEGDLSAATICAPPYNFYPRPPGGGRPFDIYIIPLR